MTDSNVISAANAVKDGGVIVYPTESVYGLGCDPFNEKAVLKLLQLKQRPIEKGLIVIASHVQQILPLIQPKEANDLANALKSWPGHHTWVFPKSALVPHWISGDFSTIAVRVSQHPVVKQLCNYLNSAIVSTSANISNHDVLTSIKQLQNTFGDKIDFYLDAPLGQESLPSQIRDAHTLKSYR